VNERSGRIRDEDALEIERYLANELEPDAAERFLERASSEEGLLVALERQAEIDFMLRAATEKKDAVPSVRRLRLQVRPTATGLDVVQEREGIIQKRPAAVDSDALWRVFEIEPSLVRLAVTATPPTPSARPTPLLLDRIAVLPYVARVDVGGGAEAYAFQLLIVTLAPPHMKASGCEVRIRRDGKTTDAKATFDGAVQFVLPAGRHEVQLGWPAVALIELEIGR
jgi:hypothetical protein